MRLPESLFAARTMQALELLALHPMSAPQVAEALQVHPRTARRLLARLTEEGWLARSEDTRRVYTPSMRVVALAGHVLQRGHLAEAGPRYVDAVNSEIGGPAHLVVPSYRWVLCIVHGADGEPARPGLRELAPCHATATGKALLAHREAWRESVLDAPLERLTVHTLTDAVALRDATDAARERGYATEDGEWRAGARAVAAPVFAGSGEAVGALGASVPEGRTLEDAGPHVAAAARRLTEDLAAAP